jgi:hypothetical protein
MKESQQLNNFYQSLSDKKWDDATVYDALEAVCELSYSKYTDKGKGDFYQFNEGYEFAKTLKKGEKACYLDLEEVIYIFKYRKIQEVVCKIRKSLTR